MLDLANIQGLILRGYRPKAAAFAWLRVTDAAAARCWLGDITAEVADSRLWRQRPEAVFNLGLTATGLAAFGVAATAVAGFPAVFRGGMASRAAWLGDIGEAAPAHWHFGNDPAKLHLIAVVNADTIDAREAWLSRLSVAPGLAMVTPLRAELLDASREHFGFVDGIAAVAIAGVDSPAANATAAARAVAAGAYVLGQPGEYAVPEPVPGSDALGRDGSYLIVRQLQQHVARFRSACRLAAPAARLSTEALSARMVGRWPSGAPLALYPDADHPAGAAADDFGYGGDPDGWRCPQGAHIRRANPRDAAGFADTLVRARVAQRRGLPYGPPLPADAADDGVDRGMIFAAVAGSIERQFEFVQRDWLLASDALAGKPGNETDPLLGTTPQPRGFGWKRPGTRPLRIGGLPDFVTMRGGEYAFLPSLTALRGIARGAFA